MADDRVLEAFEDCLARLQSGASLEQVLALYPAWRQELRPMLLAAQAARQEGAKVRVPRAAMARSRAKFLQKANYMGAGRSRPAAHLPTWRLAAVSLIVVLVLASGLVTTVVVSAHALPGDVLYPVKIATEQTQLLLTRNAVRRLQLEQSFDRERVTEVDALIQEASSRDVQFAGGLNAMQGNTWQVGNIKIRVTDSTRLLSPVKLGYYVDVEGRLQPDGVVMAYQVAPRAEQLSGRLIILTPQVWQVGSMRVQIGSDTALQGEPYSGSQVVVQAVLLDGGNLQALSAVIQGAPGFPSEITVTHQPTNTASFQPSATDETTDTPRQTEVEEPPSKVGPTEAEAPENTPQPTQGEDNHDTPQPTGSEDHHGAPQPTESEHHGSTPYPTEGDNHDYQKTPLPTRTPSTPKPTEQEDGHYNSPTSTQSTSVGNPTPTSGGHDD
jgi:Domain of unknown function (DUF5667)/Domain of unknown function (DUF5666)